MATPPSTDQKSPAWGTYRIELKWLAAGAVLAAALVGYFYPRPGQVTAARRATLAATTGQKPLVVLEPEPKVASQAPAPEQVPPELPVVHPPEPGGLRFVAGDVVLPVSPKPEKQRAAGQLRVQAMALFKQKRFPDAQPLLELAARLDPDSPEGAEKLGAVLARTGDAARAIYFYDRFLELAPNDPLAADLKHDVDVYLVDHPNPALQLMRDGPFRALSPREASLQSELARRLVAADSLADPQADFDWFLTELELQRKRGEIGPL